MDLAELKRRLKESGPARAYLIAGEDGYIREQALAAVEKSLELSYEELNKSLFSGEDADAGEIAAALQQLPFLSKRRLVLVREYYPKADAVERIDKAFLALDESETVLCVVNSKKSDSFKKVAKRLMEVDASHPSEDAAAGWIVKKVQLAGSAISPENARVIAQYCLSDMTRISAECDKLVAYTAGQKEIKRADIDGVVTREQEYEVYEMTGAIASKDKTRAFRIVTRLVQDKNTEQKLLIALYMHFRRMLFAAIAPGTPADKAALLGVKEYAVIKAGQQARLFTPKVLKSALDLIARADYLNKSGRIGAEASLRSVVLQLINL